MENFIEFINKIIPKRKKKIIFNNKKKLNILQHSMKLSITKSNIKKKQKQTPYSRKK